MTSRKLALNIPLYVQWRKRILPQPMTLDNFWKRKLQAANGRDGGALSKKELTGRTSFDDEVLLSMLITSGFYCERIPDILPFLRENLSGDRPQFTTLKELLLATFGRLHHQIDTPVFRPQLKKIFGTENPDCKERSAIFLAIFLTMLKYWRDPPETLSASLQSGLFFDRHYSPEGLGHAWVIIEGLLIEAAVVPTGRLRLIDPPYKYYIPIASQDLSISTQTTTASGQPHIRALPT